jgi:hypothetical protein
MDFDNFKQLMDGKKREHPGNGSEYWRAREIQEGLGYDTWRSFEEAIGRAIEACRTAGKNPAKHFAEVSKMSAIGNGAKRKAADYSLSRLACYLIAINGDPRKTEIAYAQAYFVIQTRRQEINDEIAAKMARIEKRDAVKQHNNELKGVAKVSGVQHYGIFNDRGYVGLYGMPYRAIKAKKRIPEKESLLDYAGTAELSANDFRITQTVAALSRLKVRNQWAANALHEKIGRNVREAIRKNDEIMPEDLEPEPHIKEVRRQVKEATKLLAKTAALSAAPSESDLN